ncbi:MAG: HPP family protein [Deltaproteobacteria bacterium]|nr:HPP family protein [Deltaproteobacteria bacterium]
MALAMILMMVGMSEILGQIEIIFPEMAALTIGLWIASEKPWNVARWPMVVILTLGATFGVVLDRYSPFHLTANLALAFCFAGACLLATKATLWPLISACMLPVLIHTETWVYPEAVFVMSSIVALGQRWMEKKGWRRATPFTPSRVPFPTELVKWLKLLAWFLPILMLAIFTGNPHIILPPLVVVYVEFSTTSEALRNKPLKNYLLLIVASVIGSFGQLIGHAYLGLPETLVAFFIIAIMFVIFEWIGQLIPPVGAVSLIPLILPKEELIWLPARVTVGAGLLILFSLIAFKRDYLLKRIRLYFRWSNFIIKNKIKYAKKTNQ